MTPFNLRSPGRIPHQRLFFTLLFLAAGLAFALRCDGASPGFEETGRMAEARSRHTATLLPNGKVLVAGGTRDNQALNSAELYDPTNRTWTATGSLNQARSRHTATLLPNGQVLVAGGVASFFELGSAELYDPASGTWTPTGNLTGRHSHTATLLANGKVLVAGGWHFFLGMSGGGPIQSAELYDPVSGTWAATGSLDKPRFNHTATLLANGNVLVAGTSGWVNYIPPASTELYHPDTGTWTISGSLLAPRSYHTATLLPHGQVLVAGGVREVTGGYVDLGSAELYDPASESWSPTGSLVTAHVGHTATLLDNGKVLVAGGSESSGGALAELYDPSSGAWMTTGSLITGRGGHTATLLSNGDVLVAGGSNGDGYLASAELYVKSTPALLNISTRMNVQTGDKLLIGGFIITGTEPKTVIVRGMGPSVPVPGTLANPVIEVHGGSGEFLASNDNWRDAATMQQISDSGLAPGNDLESALWGVINPGAYTVILSGKDGGTGIGSVEVYDLDAAADSRLANISSRGVVDTGDNAMIGGLIVGGGSPTGTANVIVRALGPSVPVTGALANPTLELHDANGTSIASNDDWKTRPDGSSQQAEIEATTLPPSNDMESALVRRLSPGSYTAIVRGNNGSTGIGLVEIYHLP
ncbi:MAG TPA: kelch repeat-containing protein [Chthoniobacterales bacterium]|nr:kelch repeat-containing protein [Chthoniobacterales bacterium]